MHVSVLSMKKKTPKILKFKCILHIWLNTRLKCSISKLNSIMQKQHNELKWSLAQMHLSGNTKSIPFLFNVKFKCVLNVCYNLCHLVQNISVENWTAVTSDTLVRSFAHLLDNRVRKLINCSIIHWYTQWILCLFEMYTTETLNELMIKTRQWAKERNR